MTLPTGTKITRKSPLHTPLSQRRPHHEKRALFVEHYLTHFCASRAYIEAGYSPNGASASASRLLATATIQAALAAHRERALARTEVTADAVIAELAKLGFSNMRHYARLDESGNPVLDLSHVTDDQWAAITSLESETTSGGVTKAKIKLADKRGPLVDLGRHLGLFADDGGPQQQVTFNIIGAPDHLEADDSIGVDGKPDPNWRPKALR